MTPVTTIVLTALLAHIAGFLLGLRQGHRMVRVALALRNGEASALELHDRLGKGAGLLDTLHPLLRGLERRGVLASREVPGGPERGGRPRVVYRLREGA